MNRDTKFSDTEFNQTHLAWAIGGAALGALAMFLSDPDRGTRRRALATDKLRSAVNKTGDALSVASRDLGHRVEGLRARASRVMSRAETSSADDRLLAAQVRQRIGRAITYANAIDVSADQGCVRLAGPVLAHEKQQLLDTVRHISGVNEIDDQLDVHERAEGVSSLQGSRAYGISAERDSWSPTLRALAVVGGSALGIYGLTRRTPASALLATGGLALLARGAAGMPFSRMAGIGGGQQLVNVDKTIHIEASPERVFDVWSKVENFPRFMSHVQEVRDLGNGRSHWVVSGPAGAPVEWDSTMTESRRPDILAWQSDPDSTVQNSGTVRFEPDGNGTRVSVHMQYTPPAGLAGRALAALSGADPKRQLDDDLLRMKAFVETGTVPRDAAQASSQAPSTVH